MYIGILQPSDMTPKVEVRGGGDDLDAFARTLVSDLRENFPSDMQRVPPATRSVMIANYERMVGGELGGHWNVLGGVWWLPSAAEPDFDQTYVLILSGDAGLRKLPTHWISLREFVKRCSSFVGSNKAYRGYVVLTLESVAAAGDSSGGDAVEQSDSDLSENAVQDALKGIGATFGDLSAVCNRVLPCANSVPVQILRNKLMFTGEGRYDTALCTGGVLGFSYLRTYTTRAQAYLLYTTRIAPSWVDTVGLHSSAE
jgi:hypothetical protein